MELPGIAAKITKIFSSWRSEKPLSPQEIQELINPDPENFQTPRGEGRIRALWFQKPSEEGLQLTVAGRILEKASTRADEPLTPATLDLDINPVQFNQALQKMKFYGIITRQNGSFQLTSFSQAAAELGVVWLPQKDLSGRQSKILLAAQQIRKT